MLPNGRNSFGSPGAALDQDATRLPPGIAQKSLYGGQQTTPTPIVAFGGDVAVSASQDIFVPVLEQMGGRCTGFCILSVVGTVQVSINGGGFRTIPTAIAVSDAQINSLRIMTGLGSSCIYQLQGV